MGAAHAFSQTGFLTQCNVTEFKAAYHRCIGRNKEYKDEHMGLFDGL